MVEILERGEQMKRLFIILIAVCLAGCVPAATQRVQDPIVVKLEIQGVDTVNVEEKGDTVVR